MAYSSSTVTKGRAKGVVVATGMNTSIGAIAESLRGGDSKVRKVRRNEDGKAPWHRYPAAWALTTWDIIGQFLGTNVGTPLQRTLSWLAISLFGIGCVFALFCFAANDFQGKNEIILCVLPSSASSLTSSPADSSLPSSRSYAIATALSMIPASLVVVLTITLAGGTKAMVQRNVIVRKLDSLEALGAVTDICSDKTGTLTQGASRPLPVVLDQHEADLLKLARRQDGRARRLAPRSWHHLRRRVARAVQPDHRRALALAHLARRLGCRRRRQEVRQRDDRGLRGVAGAQEAVAPAA